MYSSTGTSVRTLYPASHGVKCVRKSESSIKNVHDGAVQYVRVVCNSTTLQFTLLYVQFS
jgi:hypothetical protein